MPTKKRKQVEVNSITSKKSKSVENEDNKRAGIINHMILKNFMCHSLLEVNFENNVSFVVGKNGSGKSAILTALIVGLGGKATLTNRGNSVKGFVKTGKPSASIEIQLYNVGPMAYRPSVYGESIIVLRTISANGGSTYKIKSSNGETISTHSQEVRNITISLNIQVDNPICILNQDTSRNFLSSNDSKNKFTLFMKATKLESLESEYKKVHANRKDAESAITDKCQNLKRLQDEINRLKQKIDNHKSIVSMKDRKALLQRELVWAKARDAEEELKEVQENYNAFEKKLNNFKKNSEKRLENLETYKKDIQSLEQQLSEVKVQIETQKRPQLDLRKQIDELAKNASSKKREKQQILTSIENRNADINSLKQDILTFKENMSKVEQQNIERLQNLASLQNKLKDLDNYLDTSKNDLFQIKGDLSHKEEEERNLRQEISQIEQNLSNEKNNLKALSAESGNQLLLYGRDMPKIKQMITQNKHKFHHEPRGPLGSYIKIKDKKWTVAVEGYIGPATLRAFAVDNKQDNHLLREIFTKVLGNTSHPQIITSKFIFKKHDVTRNLVFEPDECVSIYNAIEIDDPVVSNCIVDNSSPENILLIPSDNVAQRLLSNKESVPRNCHQGVTIKGDRYYPDPNYRSYTSSYHRAQYLQVDTKEHLIQLQQTINKLTNKKQVVVNQLEAFRNNMKEQIAKRQQLEEKVKKVNQARIQVRKQLEELNSTAEPDVQNVQFLENELQECQRVLNEKTAELNNVDEDLTTIKRDIREIEVQFDKLKCSTKDLEERIQSLNREIRENHTKQKELSTSEDFENRRIKDYETKVNAAKVEVIAKQNAVVKFTSEANSIGERLPKLRQVLTIANELTEIGHSISRIETESENVTDVIVRYNELTQKHVNSIDIMKGLQEDIKELSIALEKRNKHYKLTEDYFVTYMKYSFKKVLEMRQFKGNLDINFQDETLQLIVIPQHGSQGHTSTSNLSGGERSFSTVAFLYSLWQCMELPFYFLDEFDVYMDKLNRTKVIDILLHHAKSRPHLQFVFLTPQDVSFIKNGVSILKLEDPERMNFVQR